MKQKVIFHDMVNKTYYSKDEIHVLFRLVPYGKLQFRIKLLQHINPASFHADDI